jgi:transcriptional regulator with GAF, ATPase, and Fis domain
MKLVGLGDVEDFAEVTRELYAAPDETGPLQLAVDLALKLVAGCDHAGVSIVEGRSIFTPAGSDDVVRRGDALQYQLDEGPCLDSVRCQETVISQNLSQEKRWPRWAPRVLEDLGIQGMMSLCLDAQAQSYGALNLYADRINAFQPEDQAIAQAFTVQISVALAARREIGHRNIAMAHRTVIGQAEGILMERLGMDPDQAFDYLRRLSQTAHRKLIDICDEIVKTRQLPR